MKKILLLAVVLFASLNANAQFYVGGSVGFGSVKPVGGGDSEFVFRILPEFGYNLNDKWAVGAVLGYQKGLPFSGMNIGASNDNVATSQNVINNLAATSKVETFTISPYARYTAIEWDSVNLFFDGGITFGSVKDTGSYFSLGVRPGLAVKLCDEISFVAHLGFLGFENFSPDGGGKSGSSFGLDFANNCSFGVYFNF
jgi:hypothetical protein